MQLQPDPWNPGSVTDTSRARALRLLQRATELDPESVLYCYALKTAAIDQGGTASSTVARDAMKKAYSLDPRNIYLITEWLMLQAASQDPAIEETLDF